MHPVYTWDQGGSKANGYGFQSSKMYIRAGAGTNQWAEAHSAPAVLYKVVNDFDVQVLLEFSSGSSTFAGMGVRRIEDEEWWLRVGRTGSKLVVDVGLGGSSGQPKTVAYTRNSVYLKISKRGEYFYFFYSTDGSRWASLYSAKMTQSKTVYVYFTTFAWGSSSTSAWFSNYRVGLR